VKHYLFRLALVAEAEDLLAKAAPVRLVLFQDRLKVDFLLPAAAMLVVQEVEILRAL
jgi:hypothetical protein